MDVCDVCDVYDGYVCLPEDGVFVCCWLLVVGCWLLVAGCSVARGLLGLKLIIGRGR